MESLNSNGGDGHTIGRVVDRVREGAKTQLSSQKDRATDGLGQLAQAVRSSTSSFREHQHDTLANYLEGAADQIERFSSRLRDRDLGDLMQDAQQFARRQPAIFIGAAFVVGAVAARFLKSSSDRTHQDHRHHATERYGTAFTGATSSSPYDPGARSGSGYPAGGR